MSDLEHDIRGEFPHECMLDGWERLLSAYVTLQAARFVKEHDEYEQLSEQWQEDGDLYDMPKIPTPTSNFLKAAAIIEIERGFTYEMLAAENAVHNSRLMSIHQKVDHILARVQGVIDTNSSLQEELDSCKQELTNFKMAALPSKRLN